MTSKCDMQCLFYLKCKNLKIKVHLGNICVYKYAIKAKLHGREENWTEKRHSFAMY